MTMKLTGIKLVYMANFFLLAQDNYIYTIDIIKVLVPIGQTVILSRLVWTIRENSEIMQTELWAH